MNESKHSLTMSCPLDRAYIAGFFDGDGYVGIIRSGKPPYASTYVLQVSIGQNDPAPLEFINARYPGSLFLSSTKGHAPIFHWRLSGKKAAAFLTDIEPYLINKRVQAQVAIKFQSLKGSRGRRLTFEGLAVEDKFFENVRSLNAVYRKRSA